MDALPVSEFWSKAENPEFNLHKIHAYPAKFPSLLVSKSFEFAQQKGVDVKTVGDIFCGCGTTALEAKARGIDFWGCDINPVATLIARVKSTVYDEEVISKYFDKILLIADKNKQGKPELIDNERIKYWFQEREILDLQCLLKAITDVVDDREYRDFFLCAFSNILKKCSMWLTKSIKPQKDKKKIPSNVTASFLQQVKFMVKANKEFRHSKKQNTTSQIITSNFLSLDFSSPFLDLLVTSPPYAVSYEYADLHQLSALWLGYATDYRELREGSIGSTHNVQIDPDKVLHTLNKTGSKIYNKLLEKDTAKAKSVAKYFLDLDLTVRKSKKLLKKKSLSVFVIGDTKYRGVEVSNSKFLIKSLFDNGFRNVWVYKRKITSKNLTPYRDSAGRFSSSSKKRHVYSHEYIITASF